MLNYHFEPLDEKSSLRKVADLELKNQIAKSIPFLEKNLDRLLEYIKKEEDMKNYIEINLPFFDSSIAYKINRFYGKIIISVLNFDDSKIFGHLIIDGYDCLDKNGIKKFGDWKSHNEKERFQRLKE